LVHARVPHGTVGRNVTIESHRVKLRKCIADDDDNCKTVNNILRPKRTTLVSTFKKK